MTPGRLPLQAIGLSLASLAVLLPFLLDQDGATVGRAVLSAGVFWWGVGSWVRLEHAARRTWFALAVSAMEADISLRYGGLQCLAVGLLLVGLAWARDERPGRAGAALGLAFALEPWSALAVPVLIGTPARALAASFSSTLLCVGALAVLLVGPEAALPLAAQSLHLGTSPSVVVRLGLVVGVTLAIGVAARRTELPAAGSRAGLLGLVLVALPLLRTQPVSPDFALMAPAYLLLSASRSRLIQAALVLAAWGVTLIYTSLWPQAWLVALTTGFRSKTAGALILWSAVVLASGGPLWRRARDWRPPAWMRGEAWDGAGLAFLAYLALVVVWARPLLASFGTGLPNDDADPVLNAWILWWNSRTAPFTSAWWNAPIFFPAPGSLALSETLVSLSPLTTPLVWLTGSPVLAHNIVFLLSYPLSAAATYMLCRYVTGRRDAAWLGGLAFGFAPYRATQLAHIQMLVAFGMPLVLLGLHGYLRSGRRRWLVLLAAAWLAQALCNGYYLLYLPVLVGIWVVWFVRPGEPRLRPLFATIAIVAVGLLPSLWGYHVAHARLDLNRGAWEILENSAGWTSWLDPPALLGVSKLKRPGGVGTPETRLFPGLTPVLLVAAAVGLRFASRRWREAGRSPSRSQWRLAIAFTAGVLAGSLGRWSMATALSAVALCLVGAALGPRLVAAWRRRSTSAFYVVATVVMALLCLGPAPPSPFGGERLVGPYALLLQLPGYPGLRAVSRFAMLGTLCLAVAAALAAARLLARRGKGSRRALVALLSTTILAEGWVPDLPIAALPSRSPLLEQASGAVAALELPPGDYREEYAAMFRGMFHRIPLLNGFSGHSPPHSIVLQMGLAGHDPGVLDTLKARGPIAVRLDTTRPGSQEWLLDLEAAAPHGSRRGVGERLFWLVPEGRTPPLGRPGRRLPIREIRADPRAEVARLAVDGDLSTRWDTAGPQVGGEYLDVELRETRPVAALVLSLGGQPRDFPRGLQIEATEDGVTWSEVWHGGGAGPAFEAAIRDPRTIPVRFEFAPRAARIVRLRQMGTDPVYSWSIHELQVEAPRGPLPARFDPGVD